MGLLRSVGVSVALFASTAARAEPGPRIELEARPAWGGVASEGAWTELRVRLSSARGGDVELTARGDDARVTTTVSIEAGVPAVVRLPARAGAGGLELSAAFSGDVPSTQRVSLQPPPMGTPVVARVLAEPLPDAQPSAEALVLVDLSEAAELPVTARAYEVLDALVLDAAALRALSPPVRTALASHLGRCGRLLVTGASQGERGALRAQTGCGGSGFAAVDDPRDAMPALHALLTRTAPELPSAQVVRELAAAASPPRAAAAPLLAFFALYASVIGLAALGLRARWQLATVPLAATALLYALFGFTRPTATALSLSEAVQGDAVVRVAAVLRLDGFSPGTHEVPLPSGPLDVDPAGAPLRLHVDPGKGALRMGTDVALLSDSSLYARDALRWTPGLSLQRDADGRPRAIDRTGDGCAGCYLLWRRQAYALPARLPVAGFVPEPARALSQDALPRAVATKRRAVEDAALAMPTVPPALRALWPDAVHRGWSFVLAQEAP